MISWAPLTGPEPGLSTSRWAPAGDLEPDALTQMAVLDTPVGCQGVEELQTVPAVKVRCAPCGRLGAGVGHLYSDAIIASAGGNLNRAVGVQQGVSLLLLRQEVRRYRQTGSRLRTGGRTVGLPPVSPAGTAKTRQPAGGRSSQILASHGNCPTHRLRVQSTSVSPRQGRSPRPAAA